MIDLKAQIENIVADAAARITALFKESAAGLLSAFAESNGVRPNRRKGSRKTPKQATSSTRGAKGAKRPKEAIEAIAKRVGGFIAKNPGLRIEQINKELGTKTKDLALPLKKLIADKVIRTKGQKRATTYHPAKR